MSYTKNHSPWVNSPGTSTPITAAKLDNFETGIADAHAATAKGDLVVAAAANDLRRLAVGANDYVLTADSTQALGIKWASLNGIYIPYTLIDAKGDLIVGSADNTPMRLAVGSNGTVLTADSSVAGGVKWATSAAVAVTAGLPASPSDGDRVVLVDSVSAPTYSWMLQYIAAKATNKWQFLGGAAWWSEITADQSTSTSTYGNNLATVGPTFTAPVAGSYSLTYGAACSNSWTPYSSPSINGSTPLDDDAVFGSGGKFGSEGSKQVTLGAAQTVVLQYRSEGGSSTWIRRWMYVTPVALGG